MIRNVLESIGGIEIYPIITLVIFFSFFVGVLVYAYAMDKKAVDEISDLPLDE